MLHRGYCVSVSCYGHIYRRKNGNMKQDIKMRTKKQLWIGIFAVSILFLLCINNVLAFEDTIQNHWDIDGDGFGDVDDLNNTWVSEIYEEGEASAEIKIEQSPPSLPYMMGIYLSLIHI